MSDGSTIEWLDWPGYKPATWNATKGCSRVSEGCRHCYAEIMAARFSKPGQWGHGLAEMVSWNDPRNGDRPLTDHRWTGVVKLDESKLTLPLKWRKPRCVFVNSTSDLFHEKLQDDAIDKVFAVMALCPQHLFIVLTKRAERMRAYHSTVRAHPVGLEALEITFSEVAKRPSSPVGKGCILQGDIAHLKLWPLHNVILGVSIEDQATAGERIPHLLATPAACRMVSAEPLLGPIDLKAVYLPCCCADRADRCDPISCRNKGIPCLDWVICGCESGPGARPMHPDWARGLRDQCAAAGVAFFMKQMTKRAPIPSDLMVREFPR